MRAIEIEANCSIWRDGLRSDSNISWRSFIAAEFSTVFVFKGSATKQSQDLYYFLIRRRQNFFFLPLGLKVILFVEDISSFGC